ncbi:MAG: glycosyltransferase family 39 protein, partial [Victivallaceae bacterium]|nr:glycosyltransferase family 39 protein [Victivallaceae bacterium]
MTAAAIDEKTAPTRRQELFFWCFAVVALFMFLGTNALWGSEDRWAECVREMLITRDWLHPSINWQVYLHKPSLSYWFIVPFAAVFGGAVELSSRIPSALAALAALYGTISLASQLLDRRRALTAGWLLLGCYGFFFWGRVAAADMGNVAAIMLATAFFFRVEPRGGFVNYLIFYAICFAGALLKGLPALVMPPVIVLPYLMLNGRWKKHLCFSNILAFVAASALYFVPVMLAEIIPPVSSIAPITDTAETGLARVWLENIVRVFDPFDHKEPVWIYIYELPRILVPWSLFWIVALCDTIRRRRD